MAPGLIVKADHQDLCDALECSNDAVNFGPVRYLHKALEWIPTHKQLPPCWDHDNGTLALHEAMEWSVTDVANYLRSSDLPRTADICSRAHINGLVLLSLTVSLCYCRSMLV